MSVLKLYLPEVVIDRPWLFGGIFTGEVAMTMWCLIVQLDLASLDSMRRFAAKILEEKPQIDILINNAGIMALPEHTITQDGFEMQIGVNHLGHFLLTNLLLDRIID